MPPFVLQQDCDDPSHLVTPLAVRVRQDYENETHTSLFAITGQPLGMLQTNSPEGPKKPPRFFLLPEGSSRITRQQLSSLVLGVATAQANHHPHSCLHV